MQALTFPGICAVILVFVTSQVSAATGPADGQCTIVEFPDMMDIGKCIKAPLKLCGGERSNLRSTSRELARCLVRSMATRNFLTIVLRGMVQAGIYAMQASLPGSSVLAFPLLNRLRNTFRSTSTQDKIIFTSRPCNETVPVLFPDFLLIGDCVRPEHLMCTKSGWIDFRTQVVVALLRMVVCVMRKLPFFNVLFLLKDIMCAGIERFKTWLLKLGRFPMAVPFMEFLDFIFVCNAQNTVRSSVERKVLETIGFNPE